MSNPDTFKAVRLRDPLQRASGSRSSGIRPSVVSSRGLSREQRIRRLLALADVLALTGALAVVAIAVGGGLSGPAGFAWTLLTLPAWVLLFKLYGLYDRDHKRVSHSTVDDLPWIFHALVVGGLGLWLFSKLAPVHRFTFQEGVWFFATGVLLIVFARTVARTAVQIFTAPERVIFVGGGYGTALLARKMVARPQYGLEPIGYIETDPSETGGGADVPKLGALEDLEQLCVQHGANRVAITSLSTNAELPDVVRLATGLGISVSILPQLTDVLGPSVEIDDIEGVTVLGLNSAALTRSSRFLKRAMDIGITSVLLAFALPLIALIAVGVKVTSPGPVIYSQERLGRSGRRFRMYKFRTMVADADAKAGDLLDQSAHQAWLLLEHDPRVTRFGSILRKTSLDELPQFLNVLKGEMSLVGPRPMTPAISEHIPSWGLRRLDLTPGLTGLWQVLGRTAVPFDEMVKLDYLYVTNWSLWQDFRLLVRTLPAVIHGRGAN